MPASKTKEVRTPKYRESIMSDLIRRAAGADFGPSWANLAPQYKVTKMRQGKKKSGRDGTLLRDY